MSSDLMIKNASLNILVMMDIENLIKNEENEYEKCLKFVILYPKTQPCSDNLCYVIPYFIYQV